jgi:hypothetical protein
VTLAERLARDEHVYLGPDPFMVHVNTHYYVPRLSDPSAEPDFNTHPQVSHSVVHVPIGWVYKLHGPNVELIRPALLKWRAGGRWIRFYLGPPEVDHVPDIPRGTPELNGDSLL